MWTTTSRLRPGDHSARHARAARSRPAARCAVRDRGAPAPRHRPGVAAQLERGRARARTEHAVAARAPSRLDPRRETGLLLLLGLIVLVVGGVVLGGLALLVRSDSDLLSVDRSIAPWGEQHMTYFEHHARLRDVVRQHRRHRRVHDRRLRGGDGPAAESLAPGVPPHGHDRSDADEHAGEGPRGPDPPDREPDRAHARAVVPERPHDRRRRVLRRVRPRAGARTVPQHASGARRAPRCSSPSRSPRHACCSACTG